MDIVNFFTNLNSAGQALFVVGVLLVITFIILLIIVFKPDKHKVKKIYGESESLDNEDIFEKKLKDIDNIDNDDINVANDKTRNLMSIVDELKNLENRNITREEMIDRYEQNEEDTAVISLDALLNANKSFRYERKEEISTVYQNNNIPSVTNKTEEILDIDDKDDMIFIEDTKEIPIQKTRSEIYSSIFKDNNDKNYQ